MLVNINLKPIVMDAQFIIFKFDSTVVKVSKTEINLTESRLTIEKGWISSIEIFREIPNECTQLIQERFDKWLNKKEPENVSNNTSN